MLVWFLYYLQSSEAIKFLIWLIEFYSFFFFSVFCVVLKHYPLTLFCQSRQRESTSQWYIWAVATVSKHCEIRQQHAVFWSYYSINDLSYENKCCFLAFAGVTPACCLNSVSFRATETKFLIGYCRGSLKPENNKINLRAKRITVRCGDYNPHCHNSTQSESFSRERSSRK